MIVRCLRLARRNVEVLLTSLILPVILMLLFVYLFGGAINTGTEYVSYVVPGVLVLCAGFGSAHHGDQCQSGHDNGIMDRFRSLDVSGAAVVSGHVAASVGAERRLHRAGLRRCVRHRVPSGGGPLDWLAAVGILLLFIVAISALAALVGLLANHPRPPTVSPSSDVPALRQQRFRADRHHARLAAGLLRASAGDAGDRDVRGLLLGTPVGTTPGRARLVPGHHGRLHRGLPGVLLRRRTG